jgi:hypothetical protein
MSIKIHSRCVTRALYLPTDEATKANSDLGYFDRQPGTSRLRAFVRGNALQ